MTAPAATTRTGGAIDDQMERASRALAETRYFEAERLAADALRKAHRLEDYERMARILLPLQEARRQKRILAADAGRIFTLRSIEELEAAKPEPGCWLLEPPLVGANGREFRERAEQKQIPIIIVVREPAKQAEPRRGWWPIVMLGPVVVRTYVAPPDTLDIKWFHEACEDLGDQAIAVVPTDAAAESRVDKLLDRLEAVRDHEGLHQALEKACHEAARERAEERERTNRSAKKQG